MLLNELFRREVGDKPGSEERIAAIRAKAASFDQERQQRLGARSARVMSPEQVARARTQASPQEEPGRVSPERALEVFKRDALQLAAQPGGHRVLLQKYNELKQSDNPIDRQKRAIIHELVTGQSGFRRGVSAGYRG